MLLAARRGRRYFAAEDNLPLTGENTMKDLPIRALVAAALISLLALVVWLGGIIQALVLGLFTSLAVFEMNGVFRNKGHHAFIVPHIALSSTMFLVLYFFGRDYMLVECCLAFVAVAFERVLNKKRTNEGLIASVFMLLYPIALMSCFGFIGFGRSDISRVAFISVFAGVAMADNTAYMMGSLLGKHKLCPSISPKKSVEGFVGGLIGGALGGIIPFFAQRLWGLSVPLWSLVAVCFFAGLVGQLGDLFASSFKRWADIKDYGKIFPGHGGIIDRLDSAMFAVPFVVLAFRIFF